MAGQSARDQAQARRRRAEHLLANAEKWERGAEGEERTASLLAALGPDWIVLHDLPWPERARANIDHVAIGPTGVFVIDTKNWSGAVRVRDGVLRQNGYARTSAVDGAKEASLAVARVAPRTIERVRPVLCFAGVEAPTGELDGALLCGAESLTQALRAGPRTLGPAEVHAAAEAIQAGTARPPSSELGTRRARSAALPSRSGRRRGSSARRTLLNVLVRLGLAVAAFAAVMALVSAVADDIGERAVQPAPVPTATK